MGTARQLYVQILRLLVDSEKALGLQDSLTEKDRLVLLYVLEKPQEGSEHKVKVSFDDFQSFADQEQAELSRTQFFTSMKKLEQLGFLKKIGGPRSSTYCVVRD